MIIKDSLKYKFHLIKEFTKREIKEKYVGTSFGNLWILIHPIVMLIIYTVIFSDFMKMKLNVQNSQYGYSIYLIPGLLTWNFFGLSIDRLSNSLIEKAGFIKKISIPSYIFQISIVLSEFMMYLIGIVLGLVFLFLIHHNITIVSIFVLFIIIFFLLIFTFSLGVVLSLFVPLFKDLKQLIPIILQIWFWMTPIVYAKSLISQKYPFLIIYNPVYYYIEPMQDIFLYSKLPSVSTLFIEFILSFSILFISLFLYKKLVPEVKDVL